MRLVESILTVRACLQAVKSLGKTLKTFQPTIREVMSVSSELRSTLEEQIGLDDIRSELQSSMVSESRPAARRPADPVSSTFLVGTRDIRSVHFWSTILNTWYCCCRWRVHRSKMG